MGAKPADAMSIPRDRLLVAVTNDVEHELFCANAYGLGAEVQRFGLPDVLASDFAEEFETMKREVSQLHGPIGFHGPFIDLPHYSHDLEVREVCARRYRQAFDLAEAIDAEYILFHSQYNPIIRVPAYRRMYQAGSLAFWPEFIERAESGGMPIYLENMFDDSPEPVCQVVEAIDSPMLKLCLDVAHVALFSTIPLPEWIAAYGSGLGLVHVNDCYGDMDDHLGLGMGNLDLQDAFTQLDRTGLPLRYVLETGSHTETSVRYLGLPKVVTA